MWQPQLPPHSLWLYISHIHKNAGHFFSSHHLFGKHSAVSVFGRSHALYMVGRISRWSPRYLLPVAAPAIRFLIIYQKGDYPGGPNLLTGALYLFFFNFISLFIFGCAGSWLLCWIFFRCVEWGIFSSYGARASHCGGFTCCESWALELVGLSRCGSWALEHRLHSYGSTACGIFLDQRSNPCLLHWQADSLPLSLKGSPCESFKSRDFSQAAGRRKIREIPMVSGS